jgi:Peptidase family M28
MRAFSEWNRIASVAVLTAICILSSANLNARAAESAAAAGAKQEISTSRYKDAVIRIASEQMDGRAVGTPGSKLSIEYIQQMFREAGLEPGSDESYLQKYAHDYKGKAEAANVVGLLTGTNPHVKDEAVVIMAHHDHLGRTHSEGCPNDKVGKCIMRGANDNASGVAALFELAHALSAVKDQLQRTIVFVALDGEECGCTGANYYVFRDPVRPIEKTVYALNIDSIGQGGELTEYETNTESVYGDTCDVDAEVFTRRGVPSASLEADNPFWHECSDTPEELDFNKAVEAIHYAFDLVWAKAQAPAQTKPKVAID